MKKSYDLYRPVYAVNPHDGAYEVTEYVLLGRMTTSASNHWTALRRWLRSHGYDVSGTYTASYMYQISFNDRTTGLTRFTALVNEEV